MMEGLEGALEGADAVSVADLEPRMVQVLEHESAANI